MSHLRAQHSTEQGTPLRQHYDLGFVAGLRLYFLGSEQRLPSALPYHPRHGVSTHTFSRHLRLIPRPLTAFPKTLSSLADEHGVADPAVFGPVVLLTGTCDSQD